MAIEALEVQADTLKKALNTAERANEQLQDVSWMFNGVSWIPGIFFLVFCIFMGVISFFMAFHGLERFQGRPRDHAEAS